MPGTSQSRVSRWAFPSAPLREQFDPRAAYLASKTLGIPFLVFAAHCLLDSLWQFDLQELSIRSSRAVTLIRLVGIVVFSGLAFAYFFARPPWYAGNLQEDERRRNV